MTDTMELHHCRHCGEDKPADQMRKDRSYASGFRPQCLECKARSEGKRKSGSKAAPKAKSAPQVKKSKPVPPKPKPKVPAEDRLYPCDKCERDDIPFQEMCKDKRKFMGVANICKACRRKREAELRAGAEKVTAPKPETPKSVPEGANAYDAKKRYADEWEYCWKCNAPARPGVLSQPPTAIARGFPEGTRLCHKCLAHAGSRIDSVEMERRRLGIRENATRKELESAARVAALKELTKEHEEQYRQLFRRYLTAVGAETEKKWVTL